MQVLPEIGLWIAIALVLAAWLAAMMLRYQLKRRAPSVFVGVGSPPFNGWYPVWIYRLMVNGRMRGIGRVERLLASFGILTLSLGMIGIAVYILTTVLHAYGVV